MGPRETFTSLRKKIEVVLQQALGSELSQKLQTQLNEKFGDRWTQSVEKISQATQLAGQTAKYGWQQALNQLEQKGFDVHDPKAFAQSVGKKALEEAEKIRLAIAENPLSPAWVREITFTPSKPEFHDEEGEIQEMEETSPAEASASGSIVESVISEAAEGMQPGHGALDEERTEHSEEHAEEDAEILAESAERKKKKSGRSSKGPGSTRVTH